MWRRKKITPVQDVDQARALRERATRELEVLHAQAPYVNRLVGTLVERRKVNHFGEQLEVTWIPREAGR